MTKHGSESPAFQALSWHFIDRAPDYLREDMATLEATADKAAVISYMMAKIVLGECVEKTGYSETLRSIVQKWVDEFLPFPENVRNQMLVAHAETFAVVDEGELGRLVSDEALSFMARDLQAKGASSDSIADIVKAIVDLDARALTSQEVGFS